MCCIAHLGHAKLMDANYDRNAHYTLNNYTRGETIARGEASSRPAPVPAASAFVDSLQRVASAVTQSDDENEGTRESARRKVEAVCVIPMCEHGTFVLAAAKASGGPKATAPTGLYEVSNETLKDAAVWVFHEGFGCTRTVISAKALRYCCETSTSIDGIDYKTAVYTVWIAADHISQIPITIQCTYTDLASETCN